MESENLSKDEIFPWYNLFVNIFLKIYSAFRVSVVLSKAAGDGNR